MNDNLFSNQCAIVNQFYFRAKQYIISHLNKFITCLEINGNQIGNQ